MTAGVANHVFIDVTFTKKKNLLRTIGKVRGSFQQSLITSA